MNCAKNKTWPVVILALVAALLAFPYTVEASTFVVNTIDDFDDGLCDSVHCSLREAIKAANSNPGPDWIQFDIPGLGPHIIELCSLLPILTDDETTIDGTTEPDYVGVPVVTLTPSADPSCGDPHIGIWIRSSENVIRGLHFIDFMQPNIQSESGILIDAGSDNLIQENSIGYDPGCTLINIDRGIKIELGAGSQRIVKNVLACNGVGIDVWVGSHLIQKNFIGVDPSGAIAANNGTGIYIYETAHGSTIESNLVSGNITAMVVNSDHNKILGNRVGTNWAGDTTIPNLSGISINGDHNQVGGVNTGEGNIISANQGIGLDLYCGAEFNLVQGNIIGADITGTVPMGNNDGITIVGNSNIIGGANMAEANQILFNKNSGISLFALAHKNVILGNEIAYGFAHGVLMTSSMGLPESNLVSKNSIHHNRRLGIDLEPAGVTLNDPGDADVGPNTLLNYPELASASLTLAEGKACPGCTVEVFVADSGASAHGEGMTFVGEGNADAAGDFSIPLSGVSFCDPITATATDGSNNTSEFSKNVLASCLVLIDPWPYIVLTAMIFTGVIGGSVGDRKSGRSPGRLAVVGALGGGAAGIGLILLGIALPNVHLELQPQSEEEELEPLCSQYLDPDGYRPTAGSVFDLDQEPLLSWTPLSSLPDVDLRWRIDLLPPNGDMHSLTTSNTSLSFTSFNLSPLPTERFRWRLTGEVVGPEGDGWEAFCAPTDWLPFSFKPPAQEETPEDTPTPSPTPTQTPTTTVTLTTTPTPTPEMCVYTAL
ncbi:MAG: CSLREA domain-containing protein, partial [Anaerolineales bacterium]|nr:CSLREA domain-containing protein [Anaerolineales bacterium]